MSRVLPGMVERGHAPSSRFRRLPLCITPCRTRLLGIEAAIIALTRDVAFEAVQHGVRVNCVAPGLIAAQKSAGSSHYLEGKVQRSGQALNEPTYGRPMGWGCPDDVANAVAFLASESMASSAYCDDRPRDWSRRSSS